MSDALQKIKDLVKAFSDRRLRKVTKEGTSTISKIPFKLISIRELYQYRIADLSQVAHELYDKEKFLSAFIITRSVMETVAMFYVLYQKLRQSLETGNIDNMDDFLMQALFGSRDATGTVKHYNVLTAVQHVGKRSKAFEELYMSLCEFTHPNWAGVYLPYGESKEEGWLDLSSNIDAEMAEPIGIKPLMASMMFFDELYNEINNIFSAFVQICEKECK